MATGAAQDHKQLEIDQMVRLCKVVDGDIAAYRGWIDRKREIRRKAFQHLVKLAGAKRARELVPAEPNG